MKKINKYLIILFLIPFSFIAFKGNVYAGEYGTNCTDYSADYCPNYLYDDSNNMIACKLLEGECTEIKDAKTCSKYLEAYDSSGNANNNRTCPLQDDFGNDCIYEYGCIIKKPIKEKKHCIEYNQSDDKCPEEDDFGNECYKENEKSICIQKNKYNDKLICEDYYYNNTLCITDELGRGCTRMGDGPCYTEPGQTALKTCEDYKDKKACKSKDEAGDSCEWKDGKCVMTNNSSWQNREAPSDLNEAKIGKINRILSSYELNTESFKCSDVKYLTEIWLVIRIISPFIVVLFGSLDFFKAITAGDEKKIKESKTKFIKRVIAFFLLIFLPFVVQFIFSNIGPNKSKNVCLIKCIATNDKSSKGCD